MGCDRIIGVNVGREQAQRVARRHADLHRQRRARPHVAVGTSGLLESIERQQQALELAAARARVVELEQALLAASELVVRDPLTQAFNRRGLDEAFKREAARAQREGTTLSLAVLDLDDFKRINDRFGHAAGDEALRHLVQVCAQVLRPGDTVCRLGGEEFALLMPGADEPSAAAACERLLTELACRSFADGAPGLAFSAGVTGWQAGEALEATLCRADRACYAAKAAGKSCVKTAA